MDKETVMVMYLSDILLRWKIISLIEGADQGFSRGRGADQHQAATSAWNTRFHKVEHDYKKSGFRKHGSCRIPRISRWSLTEGGLERFLSQAPRTYARHWLLRMMLVPSENGWWWIPGCGSATIR